MEDIYITELKRQLDVINQDAQRIKDRFIDENLAKSNIFTQEWNILMNKKAEIDKKIQEADKLNPK